MALASFKFKGFNSTGRTGQVGARTGRNKFSASIGEWAAKSEATIQLILKASAQRVISEAQTPRAKGGNMRVDTGFLWNSGIAAISGLPSGPDKNPGDKLPDWGSGAAAITINRLQPGQTLFFGWTANYARHRENQDGFMRRAAQNWQKIVSEVAAEAKARIK